MAASQNASISEGGIHIEVNVDVGGGSVHIEVKVCMGACDNWGSD